MSLGQSLAFVLVVSSCGLLACEETDEDRPKVPVVADGGTDDLDSGMLPRLDMGTQVSKSRVDGPSGGRDTSGPASRAPAAGSGGGAGGEGGIGGGGPGGSGGIGVAAGSFAPLGGSGGIGPTGGFGPEGGTGPQGGFGPEGGFGPGPTAGEFF